MFTKQEVLDAKNYIINKIKASNYPEGHPFLNSIFENGFLVCLIMVKLYVRETTFIDVYLENKFRGLKNGKFDWESFYQGLNEFVIFYYLMNALFESELRKKIKQFCYEPIGPADNDKKLEYSFVFTTDFMYDFNVNVEVKTITCDPFLRADGHRIEFDKKLIKRFFHDVDLTKFFSEEQLKDYIVLEDSTHRRQIGKNIKKINEKFKKYKNAMNVGVIVIHFATSIEEFFAYLFHPQKGILYEADFNNIDCLIFFSMDNLTQIDMKRVHIFTMLFDERDSLKPYLEALRLDNVVSINKKVSPDLMDYAKKEYGIYRYIGRNGISFFVPDDVSEEEINAYVLANTKIMIDE